MRSRFVNRFILVFGLWSLVFELTNELGNAQPQRPKTKVQRPLFPVKDPRPKSSLNRFPRAAVYRQNRRRLHARDEYVAGARARPYAFR